MSRHALQITSGVGPIEARRFVVQLAARLELVCEQRGLAVLDVVASSDDAPRSITLHLGGDAPAVVHDELGSHVLIGRSPDRGRAARKRWFAAVTLHPALPTAPAVTLDRSQLVITACRAGGPGGQHVNKVSSAVRVHHLPSGLSVRCAVERSQKANLDHAVRRLEGLLAERAAAAAADDGRARRAAHYRVERGRAVRSYRLADDGSLLVAS